MPSETQPAPDPNEARRAWSAFRRHLEDVRDADAVTSSENTVHTWHNTRNKFQLIELSFNELIAL